MTLSLRMLTRRWLPLSLKRSFQQLLLGYHSYAPSFSSAAEDMILRHLLGSDKMDGFYVDVGAFHPTLFSNTYFFYLNGWRGINLEARPGSKQLFDKVRPRDVNPRRAFRLGAAQFQRFHWQRFSSVICRRARR